MPKIVFESKGVHVAVVVDRYNFNWPSYVRYIYRSSC